MRASMEMSAILMVGFDNGEEVEHIETELIFEHAGLIDRPIFCNI
jgi:hypothetical protein